MIQALASNPWLTVAANLLGVASFVLGFFFYYKSKDRFAIAYRVSEATLIHSPSTRPFDMDARLSWNGTAVERLTRSYILIKNTGNKVLEANDFVHEPVVRVAQTSTIIESKIKAIDDPGNAAAVSQIGPSASTLSFAFLRPRDAIILQFDHTGATNEIFVEGGTKAGGPLKKLGSVGELFSFLGSIFLVVSVFSSLILTIVLTSDGSSVADRDLLKTIMASFMAGTILLLIAALLLSLLRYLGRLVGLRADPKPTAKMWGIILADKQGVRA